MKTRGSHLYQVYAPSSQYSQREREHFDKVWQLQSVIPDRLIGEHYDWIDVLWVDYSRLPSGVFILIYTIFSKTGNYKMLFQNITNLVFDLVFFLCTIFTQSVTLTVQITFGFLLM